MLQGVWLSTCVCVDGNLQIRDSCLGRRNLTGRPRDVSMFGEETITVT